MTNMVLDYTTISDFLTCRKRYYWRHRMNLVPKVVSTPLLFGSAWHKAMEAYWTEKGDPVVVFTAAYKDVEVAEGDKRTLDRGLKVLDDYIKRYPLGMFEVIASECSHSRSINGLTYCGRMDKGILWGGDKYVMEHKTTSQLGFTFFNQFALNHQVDGYIWLGVDKFGECAGVLIDAVLIAKTKFNCMRDVATRTAEDTEKFEMELQDIAVNIRWAIDNDSFPKNKSMCQYYGECPYRDACLYRGDKRIIEGRYRVSRWDAEKGKEVVKDV